VAITAWAGVLLVALVVSLTMGRYGIPVGTLGTLLRLRASGAVPTDTALLQAYNILFLVRIPRLFLSALTGAALALSGAAYQNIFRNPMVSPDILGVTTGAGVGAAVGILISASTFFIHVFAFGLGLGAVLLVMLVARLVSKDRANTVVLVLTGMVVNALFQAVLSFTKYVADTSTKLPEITFWLMGSFAKSGNYANVRLLAVVFVVGALPLYLLRWRINILSFGDEESRAMGLNPRQIRTVVILCSTLLTATCASLCGSIQWVGLIIPHIARLMVGANNKYLFPVSILGGGAFMLVVDDFARTIPGELPVGVLTAFVGAPLFIYMLFRGKKELF
jgi:iron complex transport system permease protein